MNEMKENFNVIKNCIKYDTVQNEIMGCTHEVVKFQKDVAYNDAICHPIS